MTAAQELKLRLALREDLRRAKAHGLDPVAARKRAMRKLGLA